MKIFPTLEANRIELSRLKASDIEAIVSYAQNEKIAANTLNLPHPYKEKDAIWWINSANQGFINQTQYTFAIRLKNTKEFIGGLGLRIDKAYNRGELGYWVAEEFWNKGYATESLKVLLNYGFNELELNKIYAVHLIENPSSGKVMSKNGMIQEGILKDHFKKDNEYKTVIQYRLTRAEYMT